MGMYRIEWPCCGDVSETNAWEPESCPFCTPAPKPAPVLLTEEEIQYCREISDGTDADDFARFQAAVLKKNGLGAS